MRLDHLLSKETSRGLFCYSVTKGNQGYPVAIRLGETPVPIPNTMVKAQTADGTMLGTAWESRRLPGSFWGISSVGRAPALQAGGHEFDSRILHSVFYIPYFLCTLKTAHSNVFLMIPRENDIKEF